MLCSTVNVQKSRRPAVLSAPNTHPNKAIFSYVSETMCPANLQAGFPPLT
jgi:hypothetical protein